MDLSKAKKILPTPVYTELDKQGIAVLRPAQEKAMSAGLFDKKNLLVCTPTASGKTLVGEMAMINMLSKKEKTIADVILNSNPNIKTVLKKNGIHEGQLRTQKMKFLAGENKKETIGYECA